MFRAKKQEELTERVTEFLVQTVIIAIIIFDNIKCQFKVWLDS